MQSDEAAVFRTPDTQNQGSNPHAPKREPTLPPLLLPLSPAELIPHAAWIGQAGMALDLPSPPGQQEKQQLQVKGRGEDVPLSMEGKGVA